MCLAVVGLEFAQQLVALLNSVVQPFLSGFLAGEDRFEFVVIDVAHLQKVAESQTFRISRGFMHDMNSEQLLV